MVFTFPLPGQSGQGGAEAPKLSGIYPKWDIPTKLLREHLTMKVLVVCNAYPKETMPSMGIFVAEQVESLRKEGIEVDVLFIDGWENKMNYLWGFFRLWKRLLTHRYDLIHAHYVFSGALSLRSYVH